MILGEYIYIYVHIERESVCVPVKHIQRTKYIPTAYDAAVRGHADCERQV